MIRLWKRYDQEIVEEMCGERSNINTAAFVVVVVVLVVVVVVFVVVVVVDVVVVVVFVVLVVFGNFQRNKLNRGNERKESTEKRRGAQCFTCDTKLTLTGKKKDKIENQTGDYLRDQMQTSEGKWNLRSTGRKRRKVRAETSTVQNNDFEKHG